MDKNANKHRGILVTSPGSACSPRSVQLATISPLRQACNNIIPAKCRLAILPMVTGRSGSKAANDLMLCLPYLRYVFWRANLSAKVHESPEIVEELSFRQ